MEPVSLKLSVAWMCYASMLEQDMLAVFRPLIKPEVSEVQAQQGFTLPMYGAQHPPNHPQPVANMTSLQYMQPIHPLQQPMHSHAPPQHAGIHTIGQPQAHLPSHQAAQRNSNMHPIQAASNTTYTQPSLPSVGQYSYGSLQPQQQPANNIVDTRKRNAENLQVVQFVCKGYKLEHRACMPSHLF